MIYAILAIFFLTTIGAASTQNPVMRWRLVYFGLTMFFMFVLFMSFGSLNDEWVRGGRQ